MRDAEIERVELKISKFLRGGVFVAGILLFIGWFWQLLTSPVDFSAYTHYQPTPLMQQWSLLHGDFVGGMDVVYTGLLVLILLPSLRVLMTLYLLIRQRERWLACAAGFVLLVLMLSFRMGFDL